MNKTFKTKPYNAITLHRTYGLILNALKYFYPVIKIQAFYLIVSLCYQKLFFLSSLVPYVAEDKLRSVLQALKLLIHLFKNLDMAFLIKDDAV